MSTFHSPTIEETKVLKFLLAIIIVLSHFGMPILCDINYLPVGTFFFMSGYGLSASKKKGHNYQLIKSILKLMIPFYIAELIYCLVYTDFLNYSPSYIFKCIVLYDIPLPYAWYVRAQAVCYVIWAIACKCREKYKYAIIMAGMALYTIYIFTTGQSVTFCKTIFCFPVGVLFSQYEESIYNKLDRKVLIKTILPILSIGWVVLLLSIMDSRRIIIFTDKAETNFLVCNCLAMVFSSCLFMVISLYPGQRKRTKIINSFSQLYYEIYLVQGIGQCIFCTTYYCERVLIPIGNGYLARLLSLMTIIPLAFILNRVSTILRRKTNEKYKTVSDR